MLFFSRFITRYAAIVAIAGVLLGAVGTHYSILLYKNLRTDIEELLPTTARSVVDLNEVKERLTSIDSLSVLIFCKDTDASKRFVDDLAAKLQKYPKSVVAGVEYRITHELKFFQDRRALYMELEDLKRIRKYIEDRISYEKALYNPLNIFQSVDLPEPRLDFDALQKKYQNRVSSFDRFPDGYYATPDETKRVILVYKPSQGSGIEKAKELRAATDQAIRELNPASYSPNMEIMFTGGVQDLIEEQAALIADLELSTIVVVVLVTLVLLAFYRAIRATLILVVSLFIGTLWTFGISYYLVGYLNANSAFLGSIVIGNGINFGIIFLARYIEERRHGHDNAKAIDIAIKATTTATLTASLAAGLAYGSLMLTGFRGFNQFGAIGLVGMILCWIATFTVLPALLTLADRIHPLIRPSKRGKMPKHALAGLLAKLISRFPRAIWYFSLVLTAASVLVLPRINTNVIESDLSKLRDKQSMEKGSGYLSKYTDEIFQRYLSPIVILPENRKDAQEIARRLKAKKEEEGPSSPIASVQLLDDFLPRDQLQKIQLLNNIRKLLPPRFVQRMSERDQKRIGEFFNPAAFKEVRQTDLPGLVLDKFTEKDGSLGKMVLVEPPLNDNLTWDGKRLISFIHELRSVADSVKQGTVVAGQLPVSSDMIEAITRDGPRATLFALVAVVSLVILLFRRVSTISLVLFSLGLGMVWMFGYMLGSGMKINFLNFIALPITFGIGVDYGVNIFQRYREEGSKNILAVIENTGGAVALASMTTIIGYSSLLIAGNQAFVSFGRLAVLGEITCVFAAVVSLPAYLSTRARRKNAGRNQVT